MQDLGVHLGRTLRGGECIELIGDIGAGKTTLTKGIARGLGVSTTVQSPTFTISSLYEVPGGLQLAHYDFYRLNDAGVMGDELAETVADERTVTVIEWGEIVAGVLPSDRLTIHLQATAENSRRVELQAQGPHSLELLQNLELPS